MIAGIVYRMLKRHYRIKRELAILDAEESARRDDIDSNTLNENSMESIQSTDNDDSHDDYKNSDADGNHDESNANISKSYCGRSMFHCD